MTKMSRDIANMSLQPDGEPLTIFHKFPKLPTELRLIIWLYAQPGRVVEVEFSKKSDCWFCSNESAFHPALLPACKESREVVSKEWLPFLPYRTPLQDPAQLAFGMRPEFSYFNPRVDTLYVDDSIPRDGMWSLWIGINMEELLTHPALKELRYLACHGGLIRGSPELLVDIAQLILQLQHLETISCIGDPSLPNSKRKAGSITFRWRKQKLNHYWIKFKKILQARSEARTNPQPIQIDTGRIWRGDKDIQK